MFASFRQFLATKSQSFIKNIFRFFNHHVFFNLWKKLNWKFKKTNTVHTVVNQENNGNNNACQASEASATGVASTASAKMEVDGASGAALATAEAKAANGSGFGGQKAIKKGQISKDESVSDGLCTHREIWLKIFSLFTILY